MATDRFFVEFDRGAGVGGSKLLGELVLYTPPKSKKSKHVADFRFPEINGASYTVNLIDGHPVKQAYRGKFRITEAEREGLVLRLDLFKSATKCHFCKGPAFRRLMAKDGKPAEPVPRQVKHKNSFVWCCGGCRQPELPVQGHGR